MRPYYARDGITLYHGDCLDVLPQLPEPDLVLTDPPYGMGLQTNYRACGRESLARVNDWPPLLGDDKPFDPAHLLRFRRLVLFGANHYADKLPPSPSWIVWDKLDGLRGKRAWGFNDSADCEMAWTNLGGPARLVAHRWMGCMKASERTDRRVHPTQKPIALMAAIVAQYTRPGDLVLDPYAGAGATLIAARDLGRRAIGVEIEERYCAVAARRLDAAIDVAA